ncbi:hypothetical protein CASFOL_034300 [Castilleja foliolosa]|uniref:Uncharacterized protein n=1 Tax=Castilleja foliolosa TaxID=1961234 RepID=A0ABD3BX73_9LAMI
MGSRTCFLGSSSVYFLGKLYRSDFCQPNTFLGNFLDKLYTEEIFYFTEENFPRILYFSYKRKKVGKSNLLKEGVITEEMLAEEVESHEQVNDNTLNDNPGNSGEANEELVTDNGKTCTDMTGNKVVQEDDQTVKVTKNVVVDPPEKAGEKACSGEGEQNICISNVDEQPKKAPAKKPSVSKKAANGMVIQEPVIVRAKTRGANSKAGASDKGKTVVVVDKIVGGGKRRKADVNIPKYLTLKRTNSVLGECSSKKQKTDDANTDIPSLKIRNM